MPQVFLSYSRKDLEFVEQLAADLKGAGLDVWYDLSGLGGGDRWSSEIEKGIRNSQYMILVLSPDSIKSEWVEKEFVFASSLKIKIIPLLYRACDLRLYYANLQYIEVHGGKYKQNFNQILSALNAQSQPPSASPKRFPAKRETPPPIQPVPLLQESMIFHGIEFIHVPKGEFLMGSNTNNKLAEENERPQHFVNIPYDYWIARYPITNVQYSAFIEAKRVGHPVSDWMKKKDHPVVDVTWYSVIDFCNWLNDLLKGELPSGLILRLPTEAEWERGARGERGKEWPWGNEFDKNKCNTSEGGKGGTTPVGLCSPQGDSPYGCADMAGNVWEWTHSLFEKYPYVADDGREGEKAYPLRVLRGGAFDAIEKDVRCASCIWGRPRGQHYRIGFRVAISLPF